MKVIIFLLISIISTNFSNCSQSSHPCCKQTIACDGPITYKYTIKNNMNFDFLLSKLTVDATFTALDATNTETIAIGSEIDFVKIGPPTIAPNYKYFHFSDSSGNHYFLSLFTSITPYYENPSYCGSQGDYYYKYCIDSTEAFNMCP